MPIVDASVVVDWVAPTADPQGPARSLLLRLASAEAELFAPALMWQEVANALLTGVRRGRWTGSDADSGFELLELMPVTRVSDPTDLRRAWELSRRHDEHPIYDMVYFAAAQRLGQPLITLDRRLHERLGPRAEVLSPEEWTAGH